MNKKVYTKLEFDKILAMLAGKTLSDPGREAALSLRPEKKSGSRGAAAKRNAGRRRRADAPVGHADERVFRHSCGDGAAAGGCRPHLRRAAARAGCDEGGAAGEKRNR